MVNYIISFVVLQRHHQIQCECNSTYSSNSSYSMEAVDDKKTQGHEFQL